jgi:hypothetical protein
VRPLSDDDLREYTILLGVPYFRGVYTRDALPRAPWKNESAIVNLDDTTGPGTHWVCYTKRENRVHYFDGYGNLRPPVELARYFGPAVNIRYNYAREQPSDTVICGHLCLEFLSSGGQ